MSLYKQLWLAIVFLLVLVFGVSVALSSLSAKRYLEQQLSIKNADNATALAISLTQQGADQVLMELTLAAQFDTGFYELIRLTAPDGELLVERRDQDGRTRAPDWFVQLLPIEAAPGLATIQSGWRQAATLELRSHDRFAYDELWRGTWRTALAFFLTALLAGIVGSLLLRRLLAPLDRVVGQARAIGERRFVTLTEPRTREFRALAGAMNQLSERVRAMLASEGERLERLQREETTDPVTGLLAREAFNARLEATLEGDDAGASGGLCLLRIAGLSALNQSAGRAVVDGALRSAGRALSTLCRDEDWLCGRLNGADLALLAPGAEDPRSAGMRLQDALAAAFASHSIEAPALPAACCSYESGSRREELFGALDAALLAAEQDGDSALVIATPGDRTPTHERLEHWRGVLAAAFRDDGFTLETFPVIDGEQHLVHREAMVRLREGDDLVPAARFLPWINRLQLGGELDRRVFALALHLAGASSGPLAINLSTAALADEEFPGWLDRSAGAAPDQASRLCIEVTEGGAYHHLPSFRRLCAIARQHGMQVGMDRVGQRLADLGQLHDLGIDYVKLDPVFVHDIDSTGGNRNLLRTLSTLVHAVGITVIADGVRSPAQWQALVELGVDAAGGPGVGGADRQE